MNIMLKLNHLIGTLVLKVLESLLEKKKEKKISTLSIPQKDSGKPAQPRGAAASSQLWGILAP